MYIPNIRISTSLATICCVAAAQAASLFQHAKRDTCNDPSLGYFITPDAITGDQAFGYCQSLGGRLADVNAQNLRMLTAFINDCLGPNSRIRIQTWDTNTFGTSGLAMFTGPTSGYGTVNIAANGDALYALCAVLHSDTPVSATVNNTFLVEPDRVQIPEGEDTGDDEEDGDYDVIQE